MPVTSQLQTSSRAQARCRVPFSSFCAMRSMSDWPSDSQAALLHQLSSADRLSFFQCSHAAARIVLQEASCVRLTLQPCGPDEDKELAARRHHVAMCLASKAQNVHLGIRDEVLTALPQCLHARITGLAFTSLVLSPSTLQAMCLEKLVNLQTMCLVDCQALRNVGAYEVKMHLQVAQPILLDAMGSDKQCLLRLGARMGHAVGQLNIRGLRHLSAAVLKCVAARYPAVTHLSLINCGTLESKDMNVILHKWTSVQYVTVDKLVVGREVKSQSRSWQKLELRQGSELLNTGSDPQNLANLPLEAFKHVAIHGGLKFSSESDLTSGKQATVLRQACNKLRCCTTVELIGCGKEPLNGLGTQGYFVLNFNGAEAASHALEIIRLSSSKPYALCFSSCNLNDPAWILALRYIPKHVSPVAFKMCTFTKQNQEQYWTQFAASMPAHVHDLAIQVESYQQAVMIITALAGFQHPYKLWLYLGQAIMEPTTWDQLSQLRKRLRPDLKLQLMI